MIGKDEMAGGRWGTIRAWEAGKARQSFSEMIDVARYGERLIITRNGRPAAAVIPMADLDSLLNGDELAYDRMSQSLSDRTVSNSDDTLSLDDMLARTGAGAGETVAEASELAVGTGSDSLGLPPENEPVDLIETVRETIDRILESLSAASGDAKEEEAKAEAIESLRHVAEELYEHRESLSHAGH
jgi:prevent-host-death family protein